MALYFVLAKLFMWTPQMLADNLDGSDLLTAFIALVGIIGYLPYAVAGILHALRVIAVKVLEGVSKAAEKLLGP